MKLQIPEEVEIELTLPDRDLVWSREIKIEWEDLGKKYVDHFKSGGKPKEFRYSKDEGEMMDGYIRRAMMPRQRGSNINKFAIKFDTNPHIPSVEGSYSLMRYENLHRMPLGIIGNRKTLRRTNPEKLRGILLVISEFICTFRPNNLFILGNVTSDIETFISHTFGDYCTTKVISGNTEYVIQDIGKIKKERGSVIVIQENQNRFKEIIEGLLDVAGIDHLMGITKSTTNTFRFCDPLIVPWRNDMISLWYPWGITDFNRLVSMSSKEIDYNQYSYYLGDWEPSRTVPSTDHCYDSALEHQILMLCFSATRGRITKRNFMI